MPSTPTKILLVLALLALPIMISAQAIQPLDPTFYTLIDPQARLTIMGKGFGFTEGPVWDPAGYLYVSDEEKNTISRLYPDGHRDQLLSLGDPDGSTLDAQGRLIDCASVLRAIIRLSPDGKSYDILSDHFEGKRFNSPNDVVPGPDGALYFTDPTLDLVAGEKQEIPYQGVYRLAPDGKVTLLTKDLDQPNGLAFTPDGQFLYIGDSARKNIRRYRFHPDGTLSDGIMFADEKVPGAKGVPDGMKFDLSGNLYVTGPGGIWVWNHAGQHIGTILVPEQPANLAWGGPHNGTLFITAGTSVYTLETKANGFVPYQHKQGTR